MIKSELIDKIARKQSHLGYGDVEVSVKTLLEQMVQTLGCGGRIEIRGFGSFTVRTRSLRTGRNPTTGETVSIPARHTPHFKPGKQLKARVDTFVNA